MVKQLVEWPDSTKQSTGYQILYWITYTYNVVKPILRAVQLHKYIRCNMFFLPFIFYKFASLRHWQPFRLRRDSLSSLVAQRFGFPVWKLCCEDKSRFWLDWFRLASELHSDKTSCAASDGCRIWISTSALVTQG